MHGFCFLKLVLKFDENKKPSKYWVSSSGNWTRTSDLRVMSPTSYLLLYPAIYRYRFVSFCECKDRNLLQLCKQNTFFYFLGKKTSAIIQRALPPPQASIVSKLECKIVEYFSIAAICCFVKEL